MAGQSITVRGAVLALNKTIPAEKIVYSATKEPDHGVPYLSACWVNHHQNVHLQQIKTPAHTRGGLEEADAKTSLRNLWIEEVIGHCVLIKRH